MGFGTELLFVVALGLVVLETLRRSLGHTKMSATLEIYTLPVAQAQRQAASGMVTSWLNSGRRCRWLLSGFNEINGRHVGTRTPDLYRVNYAVQTLKPFSFLAFSLSASPKIRLEKPSFGDELVTSFHVRQKGPSLLLV